MKKALKVILFALIAIIGFSLVDVNAALIVDSSVSGTTDPNSKLVTTRGTFEFDDAVVETVDISAYKIIDVFYNESSNVITYEFTSNFKTFLASNSTYKNLTIDDYMNLTSNNSTSTVTNLTLDKLLSLYTTYIKTNDISFDVGNDWLLVLNAGVYLILPMSTMNVYAVMTANIVPKVNTAGEWHVDSSVISPKVSKAGVSKSVSAIGTTSASYGLADTYKYYVVGTVPTYPTNSINRVYTITDTLGTGISLSGISSFVIKDGETTLTTKSDGTVVNSSGNTVATISISGQKITVTFDVNYITTNNVTVTYEAKLNSSAVLGDTGNINSAVLTYSNDPYGTGTTTVTSSTTVYTYGLELFAYKSGTSTGISNMTFDVYTDSSLSEKVGTITTDSTGKGTLVGVAEGTYYLKNTKTASGYSLAATTSMKVKTTGAVAGSTDGYYKVEIPVNSSGILPFTGGTGTIIYTILGLIIIMSGVTGYVLYKKNKNKNK